jgi:hypothetical protein
LLCVLVLCAGVLSAQAAPDNAAPVSFAGTWNTFSGGGNTPFKVTLTQTGNKVTGSYSPGNGKIFDGVVIGRKLTFKWTQDGGYEGTGEFEMDEDGKGFIGSSTALKPKQFTNAWSTPHKPPSPFEGDWATTATSGKYRMKLQRTGNKVTGTYAPDNGKIEGVINGKVLRFAWTQNGGKGSGRFVMSDDNQSFSGSFSKGDDPDDVDGTWNGQHYVPPVFAGVWETASGGDYKYGVLLTQTGDKVTGIFAPGNGRITDGVIEDKTLRFKWTQDGGPNGQLSGSGKFVMGEDGKSFKGNSSQTDDPDGFGNAWDGHRPTPSFSGTWDMNAGEGTPYVVHLSQVGHKVMGDFSPGNGKLDGTLIGDAFLFNWSQDGGFKGTGKLELSDDGQAFKGGMTATEGPTKGEIRNTGTRRPTSFNGLWNLVSAGAYRYVLTLRQTGDRLTGSYVAGDAKIKNGNGQIFDGKVMGDTVYFRWSQDGGSAGNGWFKMGARNRTFSGAFRNGSDAEIPITATRDDKT